MRSVIIVIGAVGLLAYLANLAVDTALMLQVDSRRLSAEIDPFDFRMVTLCMSSLAVSGLPVVAAYYDILARNIRWPVIDLVSGLIQIGTVVIWLVVGFAGTTHTLPMLAGYLQKNAVVLAMGAMASGIVVVLVKWSAKHRDDSVSMQ